jgi:hypothetical protein
MPINKIHYNVQVNLKLCNYCEADKDSSLDVTNVMQTFRFFVLSTFFQI